MMITMPVTAEVAGLPRAVRIVEVGPRDGLQNEATPVETADKVTFVERLLAAGLRTVELTSMVRPDLVPQLADAEELLGRLTRPAGVRLPVLVPNRRGLARALEAGVDEIAVFASATGAFAERNLGRGYTAQWEMFAPVVAEAVDAGVAVRGYLSMVCGDPWEGEVPVPQVVDACQRLRDLGCTELSLGDTIGVGTAGQVRGLLDALRDGGLDLETVAVHFHDTYGQALANTLAALTEGVVTIDAAAGGLGGCPFAGSATGNLATEDLVWLLDGLGITHGVDLPALVATSTWMAGVLGRPSPSRVVTALAGAS